MGNGKPVGEQLVEMWSDILAIRAGLLARARHQGDDVQRVRSLRGQAGDWTRTLRAMRRLLAEWGFDVSRLEVPA